MTVQEIPPGRFRTLNMCDYCRRDFGDCGATCSFGEILKYVPGTVRFARNLYKTASRNVIVCDRFWRKK